MGRGPKCGEQGDGVEGVAVRRMEMIKQEGMVKLGIFKGSMIRVLMMKVRW